MHILAQIINLLAHRNHGLGKGADSGIGQCLLFANFVELHKDAVGRFLDHTSL
jgi:hypothetical protein